MNCIGYLIIGLCFLMALIFLIRVIKIIKLSSCRHSFEVIKEFDADEHTEYHAILKCKKCGIVRRKVVTRSTNL